MIIFVTFSWKIVAIILRGIFIGLGAAIVEQFQQVFLVFAVILGIASYGILFPGFEEEEVNTFWFDNIENSISYTPWFVDIRIYRKMLWLSLLKSFCRQQISWMEIGLLSDFFFIFLKNIRFNHLNYKIFYYRRWCVNGNTTSFMFDLYWIERHRIRIWLGSSDIWNHPRSSDSLYIKHILDS